MKSLKDKRFRYGTFSTAMILVAIALFIFANLIGDQFNRTFDLTQEQLFSLTSHSRDFLRNLDQDVTITFISPTGQGSEMIAPIVLPLMDEYDAASSHITIEHRDPMINPAFVHEIAHRVGMEHGIPNDSVIVQSATNVRVIVPNDMFTFEWHMGQPVGIRSFDFEAQITRAINHVTQGEPPVVYWVTGSGEPDAPQALATFLESENFDLREVNLVTNDVPETADILFITTPNRDWSELKADRIQQFIDNEGRAFMALGFMPIDTPNIDNVLAAYGIAMGQYILHEGDMRQVLLRPDFILPGISHHPILDPIYNARLANLLMQPISIDRLDIGRITTTIEPLFISSRAAIGINPDDTTESINGPFDMAVIVTDSRFVERQETSRFVLVGNMAFMSNEAAAAIGDGNFQFIVSSLRFMGDQPQGIWVPSRTPPGNAPIMITRMQANTMVAVSMAAIPLTCLLVGFFIWLKRRHS